MAGSVNWDMTPDVPVSFGSISPSAIQALTGMSSGIERQKLYQAQTAVEEQRLTDMQMKAQTEKQKLLDLGMLATEPTPKNIVQIAAKYPDIADHLKNTYDILTSDQQQTMIDQATPVYAAILSKKPDVAVKLLRDQAQGYRDSNMPDKAQASEVLAGLVEQNPQAAAASTGLFLARAMGKDKFGETFDKLGSNYRSDLLLPSQLSKQEADAQKAAVDAKFAESNAVVDLQKKGWDIKKIANDIEVTQLNKKIALAQLKINQANSDTQRDRLTLEQTKYKNERDQYIRSMASTAESSRTAMDSALNVVDRALNVHMEKPGVVESAHGPISSRMPTLTQDTADYEALLDTIGSSAFVSQINALKEGSVNGSTGIGRITNIEATALMNALGNMSLKQSPEQTKKNLQEMQRIILKMRKGLVTKTGVPDTVPDTPDARAATNPGTGASMSVDDILKELGIVQPK